MLQSFSEYLTIGATLVNRITFYFVSFMNAPPELKFSRIFSLIFPIYCPSASHFHCERKEKENCLYFFAVSVEKRKQRLYYFSPLLLHTHQTKQIKSHFPERRKARKVLQACNFMHGCSRFSYGVI